ncbi:MAG: hypothetical protein KA213_05605 [Flavobacterium sp.]|nr:hypothetical protein [Flavobacterium sp.]
MKNLFKIFILVVTITTIQCTNSENNSDSTDSDVTQQMLDEKKAEILALINNSSCAGSCNYIAFGSKPCGGPREYLLFSSTVNLTQLQQMVSEYNEMDNQFNIKTNAISDCAVVQPPNTVECVNGNCVIIN